MAKVDFNRQKIFPLGELAGSLHVSWASLVGVGV